MSTKNTVIQIEGISKKYQIGHQNSDTSRSLVTEAVKLLRHPLSAFSQKTDAFWALEDVSFDVEKGDVVGIIGRNGSGKSTLLKVLSQITEPTSGRAVLHGNAASLLEVGTGFHPELTGRENIYFNGSILGMTRKEINSKFKEIVEFAEVEQFLDTPVKFYSSGMYVRLAFAVAAHLEPDILIVDEVLAVGDAAFQKKCLGKMGRVAKEGRTVLFVSHNTQAVEQLCNKCVYLKKGKIVAFGPTEEVINQYLRDTDLLAESGRWANPGTFTSEYITLESMQLSYKDGSLASLTLPRSKDAYIEITGAVEKVNEGLNVGYALYSEDGEALYWSFATDKPEWPGHKKGAFKMRSRLPLELLNASSYRVELISAIHMKEWIFMPQVNAPSIRFTLVQPPLEGSVMFQHKRPTAISPLLEWEALSNS